MGSSVEATQAVAAEAGTPAVGTPAVVLGTPSVEGTMPAEVNQPDTSADHGKLSEGSSPMTPVDDEELAARAAKRAKLDEGETEEDLDEKAAIRKCMHHCQAALEYTARQQKSIQELQAQILEIGPLAHHSESCQKYSLAVVNKAANDLRNGVWQLTGSKSEEKTTVKTMLQMLVTSAGKSQSALTKLAEAIQTQNQQSKDQHQQFADALLQIQGQIADMFSALRGSPAQLHRHRLQCQVSPQLCCASGTYASATGAACGTTTTEGNSDPVIAYERRIDSDKSCLPTPYRDERLRSNPAYVICGDGAFRRLV
eukprot:s3375_g2.t1